ncbi:MAG: serine/threonine-protein phosphatase [Pseudorhodobacter sp.]|nr:serine/threonine-protein phosphatase [Pseudorhodobacter sp.]
MSDRSIRYNAKTHVGKVRKVNEDSILVLPDQQIWVVSDGMGGHEGGDYASRMVVDCIAVLPPGMAPTEKLGQIRQAVQSAHRTIHSEAEARHATMGATVVALVLADGHFGALWAGDSRLYRLRDGRIELLTTDHSVVAALVEAGQLNWDEAASHPQSNAITRAVGVGEALELDKIRGDALPGDRFLLCSDGLNKYAGIAELGNALTGVPIEVVTDNLVQLALDRGGADNVSVIVVDVE